MIGRGIVIDTEGSGLFDFKRSAEAEGQPRLAQLAMLVLDADVGVVADFNWYIRPDGWSMHPDATRVNGLTDAFLQENGTPVQDALKFYSELVLGGRFVVAHNAQHDMKQIRGELRRAGMPDLFEQTPNVCTMRKANGTILKLSGKRGWPSLDECRVWLGIATEGSHRGMKDALDCLAVYKYLREKGIDLTPEVHRSANVEAIRANA